MSEMSGTTDGFTFPLEADWRALPLNPDLLHWEPKRGSDVPPMEQAVRHLTERVERLCELLEQQRHQGLVQVYQPEDMERWAKAPGGA